MVGIGSSHSPVTGVSPRAAGALLGLASGRLLLDAIAGRGRLAHRLDPRQGVEHRGKGAAADATRGPHDAAQRDGADRLELAYGVQRTEVVGHGVEAAGVDQPRARAHGGGVVERVHAVDELRLAGEVDIVGAGLGAGAHHRLAVQEVGTGGVDQHRGGAGQRGETGVVGQVDHLERQVGQARVDGDELGACLGEPLRRAAGQGPAQAIGPVAGEVRGGELGGVAGGAEDDDVVGLRAGDCLITHERSLADPSSPT